MLTYNPNDNILLYSQFQNDISNTTFLVPVMVEILFMKDNQIQTILKTEMNTEDYINYYYNFKIPNDAEYGQYEVIYTGFHNGQEHKIFENFYVVNYQQSINPIRLYGYVADSKTHEELTNVNIEIINVDDNIRYTTSTNLIGKWEMYLYAGNYRLIFKKNNYKTQEVIAKLEDNAQNTEFNNIILEPITDDNKGNGLYEIKEQYIKKDGQPIEDLKVIIYNINDLKTPVVNTYTDDDGYFYAYLDEGSYLLKLNSDTYNKTFRLQVKNNGSYDMQDISRNTANEHTIFYNNGDGEIEYSDIILDKENKPIPNVQVNIIKNDEILYQYYTDLDGKFKFYLDKGEYDIEYYHPHFKNIVNKISLN